jgi:hypothetical protein
MPRLWDLGDTLVVNYAYLTVRQHDPSLVPSYHLCMDHPMRFCVGWHRDPRCRSVIHAQYGGRARALGFKNYQLIALRNPAKDEEDRNPFIAKDLLKPFKSVLTAAQYLVRANYQTVYFYGADFLVDKDQWYAVSSAPIQKQGVFRSKCASNEEQLNYLRRWHPYAAEQNCRWVSLSPISRLNAFMEYQPL